MGISHDAMALRRFRSRGNTPTEICCPSMWSQPTLALATWPMDQAVENQRIQPTKMGMLREIPTQVFFSRMRSEGFPFIVWGSGGWTLVRLQLLGASLFGFFASLFGFFASFFASLIPCL